MEDNLEITKSKYSVLQMTVAFIVLTVIYILRANILFFLNSNF